MERGMALTRSVLALPLLLILSCAGASAGPGPSPGRTAVVAVAATSPLRPLPRETLRRAYLGLPTRQDGLRLEPLINRADPLLHEIFLQKVVFLSARTYERLLLTRTLRSGTRPPPSHRSLEDLTEALARNPGAIAVLWREQVEADPRLRVLQVIWRKQP